MAGKRVAVLTPEGTFGTVDEKDVAAMPDGSRVLTKQEVAERALEEQYAKKSTGEKVVQALAGHGIGPSSEAFLQEGRNTFGLGIPQAATRIAADAIAPGAGKAYAEHTQQLQEGKPGATTAGTVAGLAGQAAVSFAGGGGAGGGAARLLPSSVIETLGAGAENVVGRGAAQIAGEGIAGRALTSAAKMGVRGAVEGAAYSATQEAAHQALADPELAADKIFAAAGTGALYGGAIGAGLGGAGSLAKSAVKGVGGRLARPAAAAEEAVLEGGERAAAEEGGAAAAAAPTAAATPGAPSPSKALPRTSGAGDWLQQQAYDRAFRATGGRKAYASEANKYLANGTNDVGEAMLRYGVIDHGAGAMNVGLEGTPGALAERFKAPMATVGQKLGDIAESSGARIPASRIEGAINEVLDPLAKKAGFHGIGASVADYGVDLYKKLGIALDPATGRVLPNQSVSLKDALFQRQALDELVYREGSALNPSARVEELRNLRRSLEGVITDEMDAASGRVRGELADEYKQLKHDYTALKIGQKAAEDAATRGTANRTFSLTDKILGSTMGAAGMAMAGPLGGMVAGGAASAASKVIRERGDAVAAAMLHKLAGQQAVASTVQSIDNLIGRASKGLLTPPQKGPLPIAMPAGRPQVRAQAAMERVAAYQADPEKLVDHIMQQTEAMNSHSPEIATGVTARLVSAYTFLASKMPATADPDPLDPHPAPRLSDSQAATFAKYDWYAEQPARFFVEVAHGKLTPEGAEVAQALMPRAFAELQTMTAEALATQMARGNRIPFQQRLALGQLMNFAAVPSQRPDHAAMLQSLLSSPQQDAPAPKPRSASTPTQQSALDRLEAGGPGKR